MAGIGPIIIQSIIKVLEKDEKDPDVKRKYNEYLRLSDDEFELLSLEFVKQSVQLEIDLVDSVAMIAHKETREQARRKACELEAARRLVPTGKTAELLNVIEHFDDDSDNEFQQHIDFKRIAELVESGDVDLEVTPLYFGSVLTHFLRHTRGAKILKNSKRRTQYLELIESMLAAGIDPNLADAYGYTAINYVFDDLDAIKLLNEHGADLTHIVNDQFDEVTVKRSILADNIMPLAFKDTFDETDKIINYLIANGFPKNVEPNPEVRACVAAYFDPYTALDESANECFETQDAMLQLTSMVAFGFKRKYNAVKDKVTPNEFKKEITDFVRKYMDKFVEVVKAKGVSDEELEFIKEVAKSQNECVNIITEVALDQE